MNALTFPELLIGCLLVINLVTFASFGYDKAQAKKGGWRVAEETLAVYIIIGGLPGALAGRRFFRHKWRRKRFNDKLWTAAIINLLLIGVGWYAFTHLPQPPPPSEPEVGQVEGTGEL